jgi:hypothetical protein
MLAKREVPRSLEAISSWIHHSIIDTSTMRKRERADELL